MVILGHIDHGKTKLLDYIRKTKIAEGESGGITQHIGAYEIDYKGPSVNSGQARKITFIDTPGHEAFSHIRSRGAHAADIAVLVVAADEGVKPQTKEAIRHAKESKLRIAVAINKIDKPGANPEKVKGELRTEGVVVESLGGDIPSVNISAREGTGIDELLEVIELVAELEELKADPAAFASGVVLESHLDSRRGPTATILVIEGTLHADDWVLVGDMYGKVKALEDFLGRRIKEAHPSQPAVITGLFSVAAVGDTFQAVASEEEARERKLAYKKENPPHSLKEEQGENEEDNRKRFSFILKTDVLGSLDAIKESLDRIVSSDVAIKLIKGEVGEVNQNDIAFASSARANIFSFRMALPRSLVELAKRHNVRVFSSDVIYDLIDQVRREASKLIPSEKVRRPMGKLEVLALFGKKEKGRVIGGKVTSGSITRGALGDVIRKGDILCTGKVIQLQRNKKDIEEVSRGDECGILFRCEGEVTEGDTIDIYEEEEKRKTL